MSHPWPASTDLKPRTPRKKARSASESLLYTMTCAPMIMSCTPFSAWDYKPSARCRCFSRPQFPYNLPQNAKPSRRVVRWEAEAADQTADSFLDVCDGAAVQVAASTHRFKQRSGDALEVGGACAPRFF